jgi:hypothetical protein
MPVPELDAMVGRLTHLLATDHEMSVQDQLNVRTLLELVIEEKLTRRAYDPS